MSADSALMGYPLTSWLKDQNVSANKISIKVDEYKAFTLPEALLLATGVALAVLDEDQGQGEDDGSESQLRFDAFSEEDLNLSELLLDDVMSSLGGLITGVLRRLHCQEQWRFSFYTPSAHLLPLLPFYPEMFYWGCLFTSLSSAVESNATFVHVW